MDKQFSFRGFLLAAITFFYRDCLTVLHYYFRASLFVVCTSLASLSFFFFGDALSLGHLPMMTQQYVDHLGLVFGLSAGVSAFSYLMLKDI